MQETNKRDYLYILLAVVMVLIPLAIFPDGRMFNVAKSKSFMLIVVSVLYVLYCLVTKNFPLALEQKENRWLALYFGWMLLSCFFAMNPRLAIFGSSSRRDGVLTFVGYILVYLLARRVKAKDSLMMAIGWSCTLISAFAIMQFFSLDPEFLKLYPSSWKGLAFSTMGNPNFLGSYLVLTLPIGIYFYLIKNRALGLFFYGISFFALLATRTRGSWIGGCIAFMIFLFFFWKRNRGQKNTWRKMVVLVVLSLLILGLFVALSENVFFNRIFALFGDVVKVIKDPEHAEHAGTNRFYVWQKSLQLTMKRPIFGFGVENMSRAMEKYFKDEIILKFGSFRNWDKAHNEYLNITVATGIPSLIFYLLFVKNAVQKGWRKGRENPLMLLLGVMAMGYLAQAFFNIQMVSVYYFFMATLGLLCYEDPPKQDEPTPEVEEVLFVE